MERPAPSLSPDESGLASLVGSSTGMPVIDGVSCPFSPPGASVGTALVEAESVDGVAEDVAVGSVVVVMLGSVLFGTALVANPVAC